MQWNTRAACALCALLAIVGCSPAPTLSLEGKWMHAEPQWGLEFIGSTVYEWERGKRAREATFDIRQDNGTMVLVIHASGGDVFSLIRIIDEDTIEITEPRPTLPGDRARAEYIELARER